jgi:hypothetical protein
MPSADKISLYIKLTLRKRDGEETRRLKISAHPNETITLKNLLAAAGEQPVVARWNSEC